MRTIWIPCLVVLMTLACTKKPTEASPQSSSNADTLSAAAAKTSHEDLARMSELVLGLVDEMPALKKIGEECGVYGMNAVPLSQPLHAVWDQTVAGLKARVSAEAAVWAKTCEESCSCGLYADAAEGADVKVPGVAELRKKAEKGVTTAQRLHCAQALKSPCQSELFQQIKAEGEAAAATPGM